MSAILPIAVLAVIAAAAGGGKKRRRRGAPAEPAPSPEPIPTPDDLPEFEWTEEEAIEMAMDTGGTLSEMANDAYRTAHPDCPWDLDPFNPDHVECLEIWSSIYDRIEELMMVEGEHGVPVDEGIPSTGTGHPDESCMDAQNVAFQAVTGLDATVTRSGNQLHLVANPLNAQPYIVHTEDIVSGPQGQEREACLPPKNRGVPFAIGSLFAMWPLISSDTKNEYVVSYRDDEGLHGKWGREFAAKRRSKCSKHSVRQGCPGEPGEWVDRYHAGVDLFADEGDLVVAAEDGEIVAILPFHHGTYAIYQRTDTNVMLVYGEVAPKSWGDFGIRRGDLPVRVERGDPIAEVGRMSGGSSMLHFEIYRGDTTIDEIRAGQLRWWHRDDPPEQLLDPSRYLLQASTNSWWAQKELGKG